MTSPLTRSNSLKSAIPESSPGNPAITERPASAPQNRALALGQFEGLSSRRVANGSAVTSSRNHQGNIKQAGLGVRPESAEEAIANTLFAALTGEVKPTIAKGELGEKALPSEIMSLDSMIMSSGIVSEALPDLYGMLMQQASGNDSGRIRPLTDPESELDEIDASHGRTPLFGSIDATSKRHEAVPTLMGKPMTKAAPVSTSAQRTSLDNSLVRSATPDPRSLPSGRSQSAPPRMPGMSGTDLPAPLRESAAEATSTYVKKIPPLETLTAGGVRRWAKNASVIVGHRAFSVGLATALREAANAGVEAILHSTDASDETKTALGAGMMSMVIAANIGAIAYRMHTKTGTPWSHAGNGAQASALAATMMAALKTGTMKNQVSSLGKVGAYAAVRDSISLIVSLGNNLNPNAHPVVTQMINSAFYTVNQFMVNNAQGFHGISGAEMYKGLHDNTTMTPEEKDAFIKDSAKRLGVYVLANTAGEAVDTIMPALIQYRLQHGTFDGIRDIEFYAGKPITPTLKDATETILEAVIPRASLFGSVYAGSSALSTASQNASLGEKGNAYLDNFTSALMVATLCIPFAMANIKKVASGVRTLADNIRGEQAV